MLMLAFTAIERRLDDIDHLWRAEPYGVEEVLDAWLRHIEER